MAMISSRVSEEWGIALTANLFQTAQRRLMWQYSSIIMLVLIVLMVVVYSVASDRVVGSQTKLLKRIATAQAAVLASSMKDQALTTAELANAKTARSANGLFFYYVADAQGRLLVRQDPYGQKQDSVLASIKNWKPLTQGMRHLAIQLHFASTTEEGHPAFVEAYESSGSGADVDSTLPVDVAETSNYNLIIVGQPIYVGATFLGVAYLGMDVTKSNVVLHDLLQIMAVFAAAFVIVVFPLSYWMSRRAMGPIRVSYDRQREFVADASHELRTPLSVLQASVEIIDEEERPKMGAFTARIVGDMRDEIRRMTKLVNDLLTLARVDSGQPQVVLERMELVDCLRQVVRNVRPLAASAKCEVVFHTSAEEVWVAADAARIEQLMYILLENAMKYSPEGGVITCEVATENELRLPVVELRVRDQGPGIAEADAARIFERFYRVDKARARQMGGSGLGLSIAKWIADAHGGSIHVESTPGEGAMFIVRLPYKP
jgi:signal transduction histidine kinase